MHIPTTSNYSKKRASAAVTGLSSHAKYDHERDANEQSRRRL